MFHVKHAPNEKRRHKLFVALAKYHDLRVLGFKGSSLNIYKVLIVVIIRAVEKWITAKLPVQQLKIIPFQMFRSSTLHQHELLLILSFQRVSGLFFNLSVIFQTSFLRTFVRPSNRSGARIRLYFPDDLSERFEFFAKFPVLFHFRLDIRYRIHNG